MSIFHTSLQDYCIDISIINFIFLQYRQCLDFFVLRWKTSGYLSRISSKFINSKLKFISGCIEIERTDLYIFSGSIFQFYSLFCWFILSSNIVSIYYINITICSIVYLINIFAETFIILFILSCSFIVMGFSSSGWFTGITNKLPAPI